MGRCGKLGGMNCKACEATNNGGMIDVSLHTCTTAAALNSHYSLPQKAHKAAPSAEIYCDCGYIYSTNNEIHITVPVLEGQKLIVNGWEVDFPKVVIASK